NVGQPGEVVLADRCPGSAYDGERAAQLELFQNGSRAQSLHAHAGHADDVGPRDAVKIEWRNGLIQQSDLVLRGREGCQQWKAGNRQVGPLAEYRQRVLEPPIGAFEARV